IPLALEGRDLIAVAQTGTGKTAAYLLPVISRLSDGDYPADSINCVIMAPTRELAQQIDRQMEGFAYFLPLSSLAMYGGTDGKEFARQQRGLKLGADVVVATPGRLLAHLSMGYVDLSKVSVFILDEADRMLDMGFYDDIMQIVKHLPKQRQTLMFSATMPQKIQQLASTILTDPVEVKIAVSRPTEKIAQSAVVCYERQKTGVLLNMLHSGPCKRVIIFAGSKLKVKELARELRKSRLSIGEMHSDLEQQERDKVMHDFRAGHIDILVATDIVARGIDIDDIAMVVNYDVPREAEDYVHRIGRTARAGTEGKAVTLISEKDMRRFGYIETFLGYEVKKDPVPESLGQTPVYNPGNKDSRRRNSAISSGSRSRYRHGKHRGARNQAKPATGVQDTPKGQPAASEPRTTADKSAESPQRKKRNHYRRPRRRRDGGETPQS
ncbi:MAG: DEAD/DEAH box helicase, partial [Duncaniella sp.]|nr:DEAD/DEAH box helicase [Duncaniella sp.]